MNIGAAIEKLADTAAGCDNSEEALRYSEAALHLSNSLLVLSNIEAVQAFNKKLVAEGKEKEDEVKLPGEILPGTGGLSS